MIQGALNGTDVTPKGKVLQPSHRRDVALPQLLTQTQLGCARLEVPRAHLAHEVFTWEAASPGQQLFPSWDP